MTRGRREVIPIYRDVLHGRGGIAGGKFVMNDGEAAPIYGHTGTAQAGSANTLTLAADASGLDQDYLGKTLSLNSGAGSVQERTISAYDGGTKVATVSPGWRTNLLLRSEAFDNAAWNKDVGISVTADQAVAPDGTTSMDKMTKGAGVLGDWAQLKQQVAASPFGKTYSFSIWVAAVSGTKDFTLRISDNSFVTKLSPIKTATTTPQRFTFEGQTGWNVAAVVIGGGIDIIDATGDLLVWGADLEEAAASGDYIKTEAAAITLPDATTGYKVVVGA